MLPIVVEKTVELSGLWREFQCIFSTQSEIGLFPTGEESLYTVSQPIHLKRRIQYEFNLIHELLSSK